MLIVRSPNGVPVRLTDERWGHIVQRHPELTSYRDLVLTTLAEPDLVHEGDFGELLALRRESNTPFGEKFVVVAYKELGDQDGFVLTAYFASRPSSSRKVLWTR